MMFGVSSNSGVDGEVTLSNIAVHHFTDDTIAEMYRFIDMDRLDPLYQNFARMMVRDCPHKDYVCFGNKILAHVKNIVSYVPDPDGIERVQDSQTTFDLKTGDCDDYCVMLAVLAHAVGMDTRLVTIKAGRDKDGKIVDEWSHVYVIARPVGSDKWYGMDGIVPESYFGWEPKGYETKVWER